MNLLIPYVYAEDPDPNFNEFTYGDVNTRARKLRKLKKGDFIFFHTTIQRKKYITAYFVVYDVMDTKMACTDKLIYKNHENIHLKNFRDQIDKFDDNVLVFGDHVRSKHLQKPLLFDMQLAKRLFPGMKFHEDKSETQNIGSSTRSWRELDDSKRDLILEEIEKSKKAEGSQKFLTSEEVSNILEKDIEDFIASNPTLIGEGLKFRNRQYPLDNIRLDLVLSDEKENLFTIVEIKQGYIGRDALSQARGYLKRFERLHPESKIDCVLVGAGVMSAFKEDFRKQDDIRIMLYGWDLNLRPY